MYYNIYPGTIPCKGFVYGIINNLIYKMMKTFDANITYVHCRPFPHSLKTFQNLNILSRIIDTVLQFFFNFAH